MAPRGWQEVVDAVESLVDRALDRALLTGERVATVDDALAVLDGDGGLEDLSDHVQRLVVIATPVLRTIGRGARFTRIPWLAAGTTAVSVAASLKTGMRELQVIAALVANQLEGNGDAPADPRVVKRLAIALYLDPTAQPDPGAAPRVDKIARVWLVDGALGRASRPRALRALNAATRLTPGGQARSGITEA